MADDILWATLAVSDGEALSDDLDLELWVTDAGALYASPTREGETSEDVIGTGSLMLGIVRPASEVGDGDVVTPLGEQNGVSVVRQTIALGIGAVTLTRDRLLGLVWQSQGEAESLAAAVTEDGNGTVIAFSVDRELLDEVELKKTFGRLKGASLTGACLLDLEPPLKVLRGHEYVDAEKGEIEELLTRFVGSEAAGPKETAALPQLPSAPAAEPAAVATLAAPAGPPSPPPSSKGLPKWLLPAAAGAVIVGLAVALILVLSGGDDAPKAAATASGPSAEYLSAVRGPIGRLNDSSKVTGRSLARASKAADIDKISRSAKQQLAVVQAARTRIADVQSGRGERAANGSLTRATQTHRTYLTSLSRMGDLNATKARAQLPKIRNQARLMLGHYRAFFAEAPSLPKGITAAGLADIGGLTQAVADLRADEEAAAEAAEVERNRTQSGGDRGIDGGSGSSGALSISGASGADTGGLIEVSADYCDRTPGRVNEFIYSFEIRRSGVTVASDSYGASQTRACNGISMSFSDRFALGYYEVVVTVNNLTNNVSASAYGSLNVVD